MFYFNRVIFLNTPFDLIDHKKTLDCIVSARGCEGFKYIVTPNVDHVLRCYSCSELESIYRRSWISLCDSQIIARITKFKKYPDLEVLTGSDLVHSLFHDVFKPCDKITIIGGDRDMIESLKKQFCLDSVYHHNPPMNFINDENAINNCCRFIVEHPADFILIAVGSPQQEYLADQMAKTPGTKGVALCIGASLLFLSGKEKRAPRWMSRSGLEWLFRLIHNPRRLWRRYVNNLKIFPLAWKAKSYDSKGF